MFNGLVKFLGNGFRFHRNRAASTYVGIRGPQAADPATSFYLELFDTLPVSTSMLTVTSTGAIQTAAIPSGGGGGSLSSVGLVVPDFLGVTGSPLTANGDLTITLDTQTANTIFAGPTTGSAAAPAFRALVWADVSGLAGTNESSFAIGNDSRFHARNEDTGTTNTTFVINSGSATDGVLLKTNSGSSLLHLRNTADSAFADLRVNNLIVDGTTTAINSETVTIDDNIIVLNNNVTSGSPTEDGGIEIRRGASPNAQLQWNETNDLWEAGISGGIVRPLARVYKTSFVNADLTAGVYAPTHNLSQQYCSVTIIDNTNKQIIPDEITFTSSSVVTVDLTSYGTLPGTWYIVVVG